MYLCMYVYFDSVVHYTSYVNNFRQIKQIQIHPEPRPTPESLEDCGWVFSNSGWPKKCYMTQQPTGFARHITHLAVYFYVQGETQQNLLVLLHLYPRIWQ